MSQVDLGGETDRGTITPPLAAQRRCPLHPRATGVLDWSEAAQGDALYDLASLTLGREEHIGDVVASYGTSTSTST